MSGEPLEEDPVVLVAGVLNYPTLPLDTLEKRNTVFHCSSYFSPISPGTKHDYHNSEALTTIPTYRRQRFRVETFEIQCKIRV